MRGAERRSVDGANPSHAAEEDQRIVDRQAPQCDEETGRGRRMEYRKDYTTLVGLTKRIVEAVTKKKARRKHRLYHCPSWKEVRNQIPEGLVKWKQTAKTKKNWKWRRCIPPHPLSERHRRNRHLTARKESGKVSKKTWACQLTASRTMLPPMALCCEYRADGVPAVGQWCSWTVTRSHLLDHDEEMVPMHGMYRTLDAELVVQRTIKSAELAAFFCLLGKVVGLTKVHVDNKGSS